MLAPLLLVLLPVQPATLPSEVPGLRVPAIVTGEVGDFIPIAATTDSKVVRWIPVDPALKLFPPQQLANPNVAVVHALVPGTYRLMAYASLSDGAPTLPVYTTVKIGNGLPPTPNPGPGPMPPPNPTPTPPAITSAWVLVIEETADATANRGAFFTDKDLAAWFKANPAWKLKVVDKDIQDPVTKQTPEGLKPWLAKVQGKKLPQMLIIDQDGNVRHQGEVPKTAAELLALFNSVKGK